MAAVSSRIRHHANPVVEVYSGAAEAVVVGVGAEDGRSEEGAAGGAAPVP
jgi:hypothetical protein